MLALLLAATLYPAPSLPPDGRYAYVETVNGKAVKESSILVIHKGSDVVVDADIVPTNRASIGPFIQTKASLDASTLELESYRSIVGMGCGALDYSVDVDGQSARVAEKWITFPGVTHFVVDEAQALPFLLPAQMQVWHGERAIAIQPDRSRGYVVVRDPATETPSRPNGVPQGDKYLAVRSEKAPHQAVAVWYDPRTMLVDEVDDGTSRWVRVAKLPVS